MRTLALAFLLFASHTALAQHVTFTHAPAKNGQRIWQHVTIFANTMTTYVQSGQKISRTHNYITKEQIRRVTILNASAGPEQKVRVTYEKAQKTRSGRGRETKIEPQVVSGNSYIVMRPEDEVLVFDEEGQPVSEEEARIVSENMQFVGRPNPLAQFLHGKTVEVGTSMELPKDVAENLLGWKESYGAVDYVRIRLKDLKQDIAIFDTEMAGLPIPELKSQTKMTGELHVRANTCRTVATNLAANLAAHETRGPEGHTFTVSHEGEANIHTQARLLR